MNIARLIMVQFEKFKVFLKVDICIFQDRGRSTRYKNRGARYENHSSRCEVSGEELNFLFQTLNEHSSLNNGPI